MLTGCPVGGGVRDECGVDSASGSAACGVVGASANQLEKIDGVLLCLLLGGGLNVEHARIPATSHFHRFLDNSHISLQRTSSASSKAFQTSSSIGERV